MQNVLAAALDWHDAGELVAIATVTETWGSSPCPAGSRMAITASGKMAGAVSGGCVEGAVREAALRALACRQPELLEFGVTHEMAWEVGLACGGRIKIFVEAVA